MTVLARQAVAALGSAQATVAVAESLTGGLVCSALTAVPGSSACVLGGVVSYTVGTKVRLLGLSPQLLAEVGPVHPWVAEAMARAVADRVGADIGVSTTGVAGPEPHGGHDPGFAFIGWRSTRGKEPRSGCLEVRIQGDRDTVRAVVTQAALEVVTLCARQGTASATELTGNAVFFDRE